MNELALESILKFVSLSLTDGKDENALSPPQVAVVRGAWEDLTSTELASLYPFTDSYLRFVSSNFWIQFSKKAQIDKVTKKTFHKFIDSQLADSSSILHEIDRKVKAAANLVSSPFDIGHFKGRSDELQALQKLIASSHSVLVTGMQGIGKTALVAEAFHIANASLKHEKYLWQYVGTNTISNTLSEFLTPLGLTQTDDILQSFLKFCQNNKCFIVFDAIDSWIDKSSETDAFFRKLIETKHQSVFLFTSRFPVAAVSRLEQFGRPVSTFHLSGLTREDCLNFLADYQLSGKDMERFLDAFQGNPRLIHKACKRIQDLFGGNIDEFLTYLTSFASDEITQNLDQLFVTQSSPLSDVELFMLAYLASQDESPQPSNHVVSSLQKFSHHSLSQIIKAIEVLRDVSLINLEKVDGSVQVLMPRSVRRYVLKNANNLFPFELMESQQS